MSGSYLTGPSRYADQGGKEGDSDGTDGIDRTDGIDDGACRRQCKSFPIRFQRTPLSSLSQEK
jgi:hypothetical protein